MVRRLDLPAFLLIVAVVGCSQTQSTVTYSVATYDPTRDPVADLAATIDQARSSGKRILLQVGGDWCSWCHRLDQYVKNQPAVSQAIGENFIAMKVNYSDEAPNADFLSQYPEIPGYPHWFVLDADGKLLHSQGTAELEAGETYSQPAVLMFVDQWKAGGSGL
jgi:thiol:disulfide interchange protein